MAVDLDDPQLETKLAATESADAGLISGALFLALYRRLKLLWGARYRAEVVQTLPANAPGGYLLVTPGDTNLYIGTGPTTPLRKIPTQVV